jgi:hypothetical protein
MLVTFSGILVICSDILVCFDVVMLGRSRSGDFAASGWEEKGHGMLFNEDALEVALEVGVQDTPSMIDGQ